jgi:hypothetical protein
VAEVSTALRIISQLETQERSMGHSAKGRAGIPGLDYILLGGFRRYRHNPHLSGIAAPPPLTSIADLAFSLPSMACEASVPIADKSRHGHPFTRSEEFSRLDCVGQLPTAIPIIHCPVMEF